MLPRYTKPRTAHLTPQPITKQQVLDAAAHWRRMADDHAAFADSELDAADGGDAVKTDEEREKTPAYIVLCPTCQQMIAVAHALSQAKRPAVAVTP